MVTITIPYAPGGSAEGSLRPVADALSKTWKQPVIIESKGGGGTTIGAGYIAEQKPDGYRLLFTALSAHTIAPNMFGGLKYDAVKSFTPISGVATSPYLILVNASSPDPHDRGTDCPRQGEPRQGQLWLFGRRHRTAPLRRNPQAGRRHGTPCMSASGAPRRRSRHCSATTSTIWSRTFPGCRWSRPAKLRAVAVTSLERSPYLPEAPTVHETVDKGFEGIEPCRADGARRNGPQVDGHDHGCGPQGARDRRGQERSTSRWATRPRR